jgi:hypothetical protein
MKRCIPLIAAVLLCVVSNAVSQATRLNSGCDLATFGAKDTKGFLAFDADLRAALIKQDAVALALLVQYPLRINEGNGGTYSIDDGQALKNHFQEIFTPEVRKAVLDQTVASLGCRYDMGLGYGGGEIWVSFHKFGWAIDAVNADAARLTKKDTTGSVELVCRTEKYRIRIDRGADEVLHYRVWNNPHSVLQNPDLQIPGGQKTFEGTGVCSSPTWTFRNGSATYAISGADGCYGDDDAPPQGAQGRLSVTFNGKNEQAWCY